LHRLRIHASAELYTMETRHQHRRQAIPSYSHGSGGLV